MADSNEATKVAPDGAINADTIANILRVKLDAMKAAIDTQDVSRVIEIGDGVARVSGLKSAMAG